MSALTKDERQTLGEFINELTDYGAKVTDEVRPSFTKAMSILGFVVATEEDLKDMFEELS